MLNPFSRLELMIGEEAVAKLKGARVAVFGVGGVGGYVVEALARSGVGALDLIDEDTVNLTNLNRQIIALHSTLGMPKVDAAKARILDINPDCKVTVSKTFFLPETAIGLFVGCALANTISTAGLLDIVFGSLATLLAGLLTAAAGKPWRETNSLTPPPVGRCLLGLLPPVVCNGVIVGAVLAYALTPDAFWPGFALFGVQVAAGELAVMLALGLPVMRMMPRLLRQLAADKGV